MKRLLNKTTIIIAISCLLIGRFVLTPKPKVITKEVIKIVEVEKKKTKKKKVSTEVKNPDGSTTTETTETEDTTTETSTSVASNSSSETKRGVLVGAIALKDLGDLSGDLEYGATVSAPIYGSLNFQAIMTTSKTIGIGIAVEF
jgi:hypothetical protein